jgi:hypothetical protein
MELTLFYFFFSVMKLIPNKKSAALISQVYIVPLPDFTVYPEKIDEKQVKFRVTLFKLIKLLFWPRGHIETKNKKGKENLSPFMKMIRKDLKENSAEIYDNPSIAAVIDFKWNAAKNYFLRHALTYVIFAFIFAILTNAIKDSENRLDKPQNSFTSVVKILLQILLFWLGFYLLNTERIQLKYNGWKRYVSVFNFFDLVSVIMPLAVVIVKTVVNHETRDIKIFSSFAILTVWLEIFLVSFYLLFRIYKYYGINYCKIHFFFF